ncbi:LPS-assembly protein LptD [Roseobacter fucihabitans]|uniref:LPS-assembly protein LptD n=1 Tax=Roseobacter fucihabitans TaxID=1537242 RepID=A0ABZ2BUH4_9RHOB|nr:LPS assembly protein LptD [Roseobacter litoralis]MBC6966162.1 LPS-assembly protein LptD precursor [Roseobacter litoralis]
MLRALLFCIALLCPLALVAQESDPVPAVLIADELFITNDRTLVARGNVEAFQGSTRITATEISYDRQTGALTITGPITLQDGEGITILGSAAELDTSLQTGLLTSARMVLNQQLQLSAVQLQRVNSRYSQLYKTTVSSCKVCDDGRPPLWEIRAKRVVHDKEERQLYFDGAQFRVLNIPILYLPQLRLPDPTVERATGFLIPSLRTTSELDTGIKIPYFIELAEDRDLTVTPYLSANTRTLELRYRQAFVRGRIEFNGAISRDDIRPGEIRGYVFGAGAFDLKNDFRLNFDVEITSDDAYLSNYSFSGKDRLDSALTISRARRDEFISGSVIAFKSLRDADVNAELPTIVADGIYEARFFPQAMGGELRLDVNGHNHYRYSDDDIVGRDVGRFSTEVDWLRSWTLAQGLRSEVVLGAAADLFNITQDSTVPQNQTQLSPHARVAFRYPMARTTAGGVSELLEPIVQFAWTGGNRLNIPNEESTRVEFDGGNLISLSRFPEPDRRERGRATALGINWARFNPNGYDTSLTLGQVLRDEADEAFTVTSGLTGTTSNYLIAGQVKSQDDWSITARTLFDDGFDFSKAEIRGNYIHNRGSLSGSYVWLTQDAVEERPDSIAEVALRGAYRVNKYWTTSANWRYDIALDRAANLGMGLTYNNECVSVNFAVSRDYATSRSLAPSTTLGLSIGLRGFSARKGTETYTRTCGK